MCFYLYPSLIYIADVGLVVFRHLLSFVNWFKEFKKLLDRKPKGRVL
jgi:hypothetical protein